MTSPAQTLPPLPPPGTYPDTTATLPPGWTFNFSTIDWTGGEWAVVCFGSVLLAVNLAGLVALNRNRHVRYVKVMGMTYVNMMLLACMAFWISALTVFRIIPQTGAFLVCSFWGVWLYYGSSVAIFLAFISKLWHLDLILVQRRRPTFGRAYVIPAILFLPAIVYCSIVTAQAANGPFVVNNLIVMCNNKSEASVAWYVHLVLLAVIAFVLNFRLHNVRTRIYNLYWRGIISLISFGVALIVAMVINVKSQQYLVWGRVTSMFLITFMINFVFAVNFLPAVYDLLVRHEAASREFENAVNNRHIIVDPAEASESRSATGTGTARTGAGNDNRSPPSSTSNVLMAMMCLLCSDSRGTSRTIVGCTKTSRDHSVSDSKIDLRGMESGLDADRTIDELRSMT